MNFGPKSLCDALADRTPAGQANHALVVMIVFFAIINAGILAIAEVLCAYHLSGWMLAVCAIASAVLLGPAIVVQIVTGVLYAVTGNKAIANMGIVTTMLPISPLVPIGLPFGIWARGVLGEVHEKASSSGPDYEQKNWGATTLVFLRDSRNARVVSLLETLGCIGIFLVIGIYWFGLYPVSMNLRVVGDLRMADGPMQVAIEKSIQSRAPGTNCLASFTPDNRLTVRCWQFQQEYLLEQLALPHAPILRSLVDPNQPSGQSDSSYVPVMSSIPLEETANRDTTSGKQVLCNNPDFKLESAWVTKVEWVKSDQLRLVLSVKGDEELRNFAQSHPSPPRIAIVVQGWIEGISIGPIRDRQITFRMADVAKKSRARIQAAIRGPALPCEFELLD